MPPDVPRRGLWARLGVNTRRAASCALVLGGTPWPGLCCSAPEGPGRSLGADLGTFSVEAERDTNECGSNALDNPLEFSFDVELARADSELFWNGAGGRLNAGGDFELTANVLVPLRAARGTDAGCSIARADRIAGVLAADDSGAITSFTGEMHFAFSATPESNCTLEERQAADLPELPCRLSYALRGRRTRAPMP